MDMAMLDVTDVPRVELRDEVVVLGGHEGTLRGTLRATPSGVPSGTDSRGGSSVAPEFIGADEIASAADTIPWEVLTSISRRVPRFYREP
jgi:alanine racemase